MPLTTMLNKLPKVCLSTEKMLNCVRLRLMHQFYYYGFEAEGNDFVASDLLRSTTGSTFTVHFRGQDLGQFHIPTFGRHNIMNATAVIGLLYTAGLI